MRHYLLLVIVVLASTTAAPAENSAPGEYVPPLSPDLLQKSLDAPVSQADIARYLRLPAKTTLLTTYAGQNEMLKSQGDPAEKVLDIAAGFEVDYNEQDLFGPSLPEGGQFISRAIVSSLDAQALRLCLDLSALRDGEEVFVVDPILPRAFGPFTAAHTLEEGRWLPVTEGDWTLLLLRSPFASRPVLRLTNVAHFYRAFGECLKELWCNINIACEADPTLQNIASGVGMLVVPQASGDHGLCTCTLINNADTAEREPYVLTSYHCIPEVVSARQADVVWDYRAKACDTNDPPPLGSLPRSKGYQMLATDSSLDITLMELNSVPNGAFGRYYAGWTDRAVFKDEEITGIHHPEAKHMRISYGDILSPNVVGLGYTNQIRVRWHTGVTEGGSSGLGLLLNSSGYKIIGTLSGGPQHSCNGSNNTDQFSSFRAFFPQVERFLTGTTQANDGGCPAEVAFKNQPQILEQLRTFRDESLMDSFVGKRLVRAYYLLAPGMAKSIERSPEFAAAFRAMALTFLRATGKT